MEMKNFPRPKLSHSLRITAFVAAGLLTLTSVVSSASASSSCAPVPALDNAHLVKNSTLNDGVKALAWQWPAGYEAKQASLSAYGTKVSVATGNLRNIDLGVLHWNIPQTQNLKTLSASSEKAIASLNGDYFDGSGPWNAMVEDGQMLYSPPGDTGVLGMTRHLIDSRKGFRSTGSVKVGKKKIAITGVNQLRPSSTSVVVYQSNYIHAVTPKGQLTLVLRNGKLDQIYPTGASVPVKFGTIVVQINGRLATVMSKVARFSKSSVILGTQPKYENRIAADTVSPAGSMSSPTTTLAFDSFNFGSLSAVGATLFDENYAEVTKAGKVTIRVLPNAQGQLVIKNVYRKGYVTAVDAGGYIIQANGTAALTALKYRAGDIVTLSRGYQAEGRSQFITAAGRGPRLVQNGKFVWSCASHPGDYRPRSAIGWNQDGQIWFMTSSRGEDADDSGFRLGGSTSDQMGRWLMSLGATDVVLLDGGGSTTMHIKDPETDWQRFDLPDSAWIRALANAFSLERKY